MGLIPYELLVPLGQLKALNLSGNHLVNVSMQIIHPVNGLEVCRHLERDVVSRFAFGPHIGSAFHVESHPREAYKIYRLLSFKQSFIFDRHLIYHEIN